jgi:hypothetical protein
MYLYSSSEFKNFIRHFLLTIFSLPTNVMSREGLLGFLLSHAALVDIGCFAYELLDLYSFESLINEVGVFTCQLFVKLTLANRCEVPLIEFGLSSIIMTLIKKAYF